MKEKNYMYTGNEKEENWEKRKIPTKCSLSRYNIYNIVAKGFNGKMYTFIRKSHTVNWFYMNGNICLLPG